MTKFYNILFVYFTVSYVLGILYMIWKTCILDGQYYKDPYLRRDWYFFIFTGYITAALLIIVALVELLIHDIKKIKWK